jgi:hypothetical protein
MGLSPVFALIALIVPAACASSAEDESPIGGDPETKRSPTIPTPSPGTGAKTDGSCTRSTDCPAPPPCEEAACIDAKCVQRAIKCEAGDECAPNACDPATSACVTTPAADRTKCDNGFGQCVSGTCEKLTSCFGDSPQQYLHCDGTNYRDLSTGLYPTSRVSTYACASGESTTEVALEFDPTPGSNVTVTLAVTDASDADLDLIVLEGQCTGAASCAAHSITAGTGTESASFVAQAGKTYYVVVDGKVATSTNFRVTANCN